MKGPTIWRLAEGRARRTCISPRSTARGIISISIASALTRSPGTGSGQGLQLIYRPPKTRPVQNIPPVRSGAIAFRRPARIGVGQRLKQISVVILPAIAHRVADEVCQHLPFMWSAAAVALATAAGLGLTAFAAPAERLDMVFLLAVLFAAAASSAHKLARRLTELKIRAMEGELVQLLWKMSECRQFQPRGNGGLWHSTDVVLASAQGPVNMR